MVNDDLNEIRALVAAHLGDDLKASATAYGELTIEIPVLKVVAVLRLLRDDPICKFTQLVDLCGVDYPERAERFDVVYHLLSLQNNLRIRVKAKVGDDKPVASAIDVYPCAGWFEREAFDMYGIVFEGNPDMRRILTDYGFEGHPLRKDFPLTGHVQVRYDDQEKRVVYEPVALVQDYRNFDYVSPWEGARAALPGDEKAK